ncbi:condensation domain-containing protein, partial [Microbacterium sp. 18062]|uniref:condensation domain-containing protein n=1 Tax=Microbacterium sp. 18062 TaxID=2681410 RepID=UPI001F3C360F
MLDGFAHQVAPFAHISSAVGADRAAGRNPLFQIMLTHQSHGNDEPLWLGQATATTELAPLGAVKTDLDLYLTDTTDGMSGTLSYATDLFDPATVARFVGVFRRVLEAIASFPDERVSGLDLLP